MSTQERQLLQEAAALLAQGGQSQLGDDGEGITLQPSGKIRAIVNGKRYELRRVKIGEFRRFNERLHEIDAEEKERIAQATSNGSGLPARIDSTDLLLGWFRLVFETLGAPLQDDDDDLPVWMTNPTLPIEFVRHWREAPLARSVPR